MLLFLFRHFGTCSITFYDRVTNCWEIAVRVFEVPVASGWSLHLPLEVRCKFSKGPECSGLPVLKFRSSIMRIFCPFQKNVNRSKTCLQYDIKSQARARIFLIQKINSFFQVQNKWSRIGRLESLKHLWTRC